MDHQISPHKWQQIKAVITDFDGVMTDNTVYVDQRGIESVRCNRGDGWGVRLLQEGGIDVMCITTEINPSVVHRCSKLGIHCKFGVEDKSSALFDMMKRIAVKKKTGISVASILYIGNDTNDVECMRLAGISVCPADAEPEVRHVADWITQAKGGEGVLREVARELLRYRDDS